MIPQVLKPGTAVVLRTPENARLDGQTARVERHAQWGAHVRTIAAATGQFRAAWEEMELLHETNGKARAAVESGYTGDPCQQCGMLSLRRTGACVTCDNCGFNEGCG